MTATARKLPHPMTAEEFFDWDGSGHVGKLELVDGMVRAQSYASGGHATIQGNISRLLGNHLRNKRPGCRVGTEAGVIPRLDPSRNVRKPDVSVTCTPHSRGERSFPDPILIVEVLSPSNADETWESIWACATIPSLAEIVVVASDRMHADVFCRDAQGFWPDHGVVVTAGGIVRLPALGLDMSMEEIYWNVVLGA